MSEFSSSPYELQQRIEQLEQERAAWQFERDQLLADLNEQARMLQQAWLQLETQRRSQKQAEAKPVAQARCHKPAGSSVNIAPAHVPAAKEKAS